MAFSGQFQSASHLQRAHPMSVTPRNSRSIAALILSALMLAGSASTASAQYFGRNKVQFKKFDFQVMKTDHFDIYFYPSEREGIDIAARMAERWHARLERTLNHTLSGRQALVLYASHPDFEQTNTIEGELNEGVGGVTESTLRRIVLPLAGPLADTDHVIGHELVHAFQYDIANELASGPGRSGAEALPLWFIEGMAEYLSIGPVDPNTAMWLRDAVAQDKLPTISDLNNPKYFPYRWGQAFWAYVAGRWGDDAVRRMLNQGTAAGSAEVAIERVLNMKEKDLSADWQAAIRSAYQPILATTTPPNEVGHLLTDEKAGGDLNVGPSLSPDGKWIAFLSERGLLSIDLFIADAATGRVVHKLTSTSTDQHTSSIQFIYSAGGWDATSKRIAIGTVTGGHSALSIFDAESARKDREIELPTLDEIFNPTWSPDGNSVAFTGMSRGLTDLYVYDLEAEQLRALTNDAYAELQPSWSPDGRLIAFATDRFSSDMPTLAFGAYHLATIDPATSVVQEVAAIPNAKNINPQWAPDSSALYFIADKDGISNLFRVALEGGVINQVTNVGSGLSGITGTSPALSVASKSGMAAFSVYQAGHYEIYTLDQATIDAQRAPAANTAPRVNAAALPPLDRQPSEVAAQLADATTGLPPVAENPVDPYKPHLSLQGVGQPTVAVGVDRFGAALGGGISFSFGDMLGDQNLSVAVQVSSGLSTSFSAKNTAVQAAYLNRKSRWNWGFVGGQIPYLSGGAQSGIGTINGVQAQVNQSVIYRQTELSGAGVIAYPFNRAQRVEFQTGISRISFDQVVRTQAFSLRTGQLISDNTTETSLADSLTMATTSAALVYDSSSFGATSPVQGQAYRFEVTPTFGSIQFASALADYRRYFMPARFYTIATRVLHYGRYGSGGDDPRLRPLFIGYPNLVRGYDINTINEAECVANATSTCPTVDRLMGNRLLVGNLEFRFPLLRPFGGMYGPVPLEFALFADGGVAWNNGQKPAFLGGDRDGVSSVGVALRANLLGFGVGEFDFSRPLQRIGQGWVFQFNFSPGF
jgi:Tol biopolymer transport system component